MSSIAWHILEAHFWAALERPSGERAAYLDDVCGEDAALRERLAEMLADHERASAFFEALRSGILPAPAEGDPLHGVFRLVDELRRQDPQTRASRLDEIGRTDSAERLRLEALVREWGAATGVNERVDADRRPDPHGLVGKRVRHYEVQAWLGGGGMGVVYRADDTKLGRMVALKFLPPAWGRDVQAKERFAREARAASALDHPNICTIHEIDETSDERLFIAMAFYEGETLKKKIGDGPLALETALDFALQLTHGLVQAHERGIIHRDVKPANVMVTESMPGQATQGLVKILDFGLAKLVGAEHITRPGTTLGTVAYMSPEQARGEVVDHRTDLWAFGIVLFEMLTGAHPFQGDYDQALLYAIVNEKPTSLGTLRPDLPPALGGIITRCLAKDPAERYQSMIEVAADLKAMRVPVAPPSRKRRQALSGIVFSVAGVLFLALILLPGLRQAFLQGLGFDVLPEHKRLVVLAFENVGENAKDALFVEGFYRTFASRLGRLGQLRPTVSVAPVSDVRKYGVQSPSEARERLGANLVVAGFLWRVEGRLRLTLELIDPHTNRILDSMEAAEAPGKGEALQNRALSSFVAMLDKHLPPEGRAELLAGGTEDPVAEKLYIEGQGYLQRADEGDHFIEAALRRFGQALDRDSTFALVYAGLGEAYWRKYEETKDLQWTDRALYYSRRALALRDDLAPVYLTLGIIHAGQGRYEASHEAFRKTLALDPGNVEALREHAKVYAREGRDDVAEEMYQRAVALNPNQWKGYNFLAAFYLKRGRDEEAIRVLREALALVPENRSILNNLVVAYWRLERIPAALRRLEQLIAVEPEYFSARKNLGTAYFYTARFEEASRQYEAALALRPLDFHTLGYLGDARMAAGRPEQAREAYRKGLDLTRPHLRIDPNSADVLGRMAWHFLHLGRTDSARIMLAHLEAQPIPDSPTQWGVGETYALLKDTDKAFSWMSRALEGGYGCMQARRSPWLAPLRPNARFRDMLEAYCDLPPPTERG